MSTERKAHPEALKSTEQKLRESWLYEAKRADDAIAELRRAKPVIEAARAVEAALIESRDFWARDERADLAKALSAYDAARAGRASDMPRMRR